MLTIRSTVAAVLLVCLLSCDLIEPEAAGRLQVSRDPPRLVLRNTGTQTIYFVAMERSTAAASFWGPCYEPEICPRIEPGKHRLLPYDSIRGYRPDADTAHVYWWHLVPHAGGGFRSDRVRVVEVPF